MFEIFVSYARLDNAPTPGFDKEDGFVTLLWERLRQQLDEMNAGDVKFWFDKNDIKKSEQFDDKIDVGLKRADLLLVVLSPNWMKSENCQKELAQFAEHRRREGDTKPKERIIVVSKRYVADEKRPALLQLQDSYRFYQLEKGQPEEAQLEYFRVAKFASTYMDLLNELARDIAERAHAKRQKPAAAEAAAPPKVSRGTVYLAKTTGDLQPVYNRLYDEISGSNYEVVPARDADLSDENGEAIMRSALDRSKMSIHLLGRYPEQSVIAERGGLPKVISLIRQQLNEAVKRPASTNGTGASGDFKRLIWAPKVLEDSDGIPYFSNREPNEALRLFQGGDVPLPPQDIVDGSEASSFSDIVKQELSKVRVIHQAAAVGKGDKVCILNANEDAPYLSELIDALQALNLDPRVPTQTGTAQEITSSTKKELQKCDAVIVLWGQVHEGRVEKKWSQYLNPEYLSRVRPQELPLRVLVLGPEPRLDKSIRKKARPKDEIDVVTDLTADWISLDRLREAFEVQETVE